jgi:hypothetical protein
MGRAAKQQPSAKQQAADDGEEQDADDFAAPKPQIHREDGSRFAKPGAGGFVRHAAHSSVCFVNSHEIT